MSVNIEAAKGFYNIFSEWTSKKTQVVEYIADNYFGTNNSTIYDNTCKSDKLSSKEKLERNEKLKQDLQMRKMEEELGSYFDLTETLTEYADELDAEAKQEIFDGLKESENYEYFMLGIGEVFSKDLDSDGQLSFEEFLEAEMKENPDTDFDEELQTELKIAFDSIASYNNDVETDNDSEGKYISYNEMANYYQAIDKTDNEDLVTDKKLTIGNSFDDLTTESIDDNYTAETPTIVIDSFEGDEKNNIDCPSRLIKNIYGVSYWSEEGKEIWNKIKELNPGIDEDNFPKGCELVLA